MKEEMNMKINRIIIAVATAAAALTLSSCEDFLDRPAEDNYNVGTFYKNDTQCEQGVNYLYNSPWYDFQRGFIKIGEVMSGNMHWGSSPYLDFSTNGTDTDLMNMSYSLWAVNGHANIVIHNIENSEGPSAEAKMKTIGEALTWKAFAYFFLVRTFGEVPIIHDNTELLGTGAYNTVSKVTRANLFLQRFTLQEQVFQARLTPVIWKRLQSLHWTSSRIQAVPLLLTILTYSVSLLPFTTQPESLSSVGSGRQQTKTGLHRILSRATSQW